MIVSFKTVLSQYSEIDSLKIELAQTQYIALQTDSALNVLLDVYQEQGVKYFKAKTEINRLIKKNVKGDNENKKLRISLLKQTNKVIRAREANIKWFGAGLGLGISMETIGLIIGLIIK